MLISLPNLTRQRNSGYADARRDLSRKSEHGGGVERDGPARNRVADALAAVAVFAGNGIRIGVDLIASPGGAVSRLFCWALLRIQIESVVVPSAAVLGAALPSMQRHLAPRSVRA